MNSKIIIISLVILAVVVGFFMLSQPRIVGKTVIESQGFSGVPLPGPLWINYKITVTGDMVNIYSEIGEIIGGEGNEGKLAELSNLTAENAEWIVQLPLDAPIEVFPSLESTYWKGNINEGEKKIFEVTLKPKSKGYWPVRLIGYSGNLTGEGVSTEPGSYQMGGATLYILYDGTNILLNPECYGGTIVVDENGDSTCVARGEQVETPPRTGG